MKKEASQTFNAKQGLPNDTQIDLLHETSYMNEFISIFVGEPISIRKRVVHVNSNIQNTTNIEAHLRR